MRRGFLLATVASRCPDGLATFNFDGRYANGTAGNAYGHLGDTYGFTSTISYFPEPNVALAVATNLEEGQSGPSEVRRCAASPAVTQPSGCVVDDTKCNTCWAYSTDVLAAPCGRSIASPITASSMRSRAVPCHARARTHRTRTMAAAAAAPIDTAQSQRCGIIHPASLPATRVDCPHIELPVTTKGLNSRPRSHPLSRFALDIVFRAVSY